MMLVLVQTQSLHNIMVAQLVCSHERGMQKNVML